MQQVKHSQQDFFQREGHTRLSGDADKNSLQAMFAFSDLFYDLAVAILVSISLIILTAYHVRLKDLVRRLTISKMPQVEAMTQTEHKCDLT